MPADSRIIHALRFLGIHFGQTLGVQFFLDGCRIQSEEMFDPYLALAPIATAADRASRMFYERPLLTGDPTPNADSAFGVIVSLIPDLQSIDLFLLIAAAEDFFGISSLAHTEGKTEIELRPILDRIRLAAD